MSTPLPLFLQETTIAASAADIGLNANSAAQLQAIARHIAADPERLEAVAALHHVVFHTASPLDDVAARADAILGEQADAMHALMVLDCTRLVRERQASRGVPAGITQAVNDRHGAAWLRDAEQRGQIAIDNWIPGWLRLVASGNLYRLGRLEFAPQPFDQPFRAFRNAADETLVLADAGTGFTDDGYMVGAPTWTSVFEATDAAFVGTPILPDGRALRASIRLPRPEWRQVLAPGDPVLDMHIPAEGPFTLDAIADALAQSVPFFQQFEAGTRFLAFTCWSWLFSPQLEAMLGADSNIVRWQRTGYMLPNDSGADDFLTFTFNQPAIDLATAPRDTRLRRAVIAFLEQGGTLMCGSFLLLADDRERMLDEPYRQRSDEIIRHLLEQADQATT